MRTSTETLHRSAQNVPSLSLTDLSIKSLKSDTRTDFWDAKIPSFGVRVGPRSKTFILKQGNSRQTIGQYPSISLQEARRKALALKSADTKPRNQTTFLEAYTAFKEI